MSSGRYRVRVENQEIGPHSLDALRDMAATQAFTAKALVTEEGIAAWRQIQDDAALREYLFPGPTKFKFKAKAFETVNAANDEPLKVEHFLQGNLSRQVPHEPEIVIEDRRPNRRRRDFILTVLVTNGGLILLMAVLPRHTLVLVLGFMVMIPLNFAIYWVLYHVMDRY